MIEIPYGRLVTAGVALTLLTASHWKAYHSGKMAVRSEIQAEKLDASETARLREKALALTNERNDRDYQKTKTSDAARQRVTNNRLREFEAANASNDSPAECRIDDPSRAIANQCAAALVGLDGYAQGLRGKARALQNYAAGLQLEQAGKQ